MNMASETLQVLEDGTIRVAGFELPLSAALSEQYIMMLAFVLNAGLRMDMPDCEEFASELDFKLAVDNFRVILDERMISAVERLLAAYPVNMTSRSIGGVSVEEFTPLDDVDESRILINLHGGAFLCGRTHIGRIESIPVAHKGKMRVISVDYRQGYEHKFPAATEDVIAVYQALLKDYSPSQIGIFGTSAGGMLTAQATAWMIDKEIPTPGGIGIFSAGTGGAGDGDYFGAIGTAETKIPFRPMAKITEAPVGYFSTAKADDYLANPVLAPISFRAKFPPTLLITGTRAFDLSPAIAMHRSLEQSGVDASLHVFDGVGHGFFYDAMTPESLDAYQTMIRFFKKKLTS